MTIEAMDDATLVKYLKRVAEGETPGSAVRANMLALVGVAERQAAEIDRIRSIQMPSNVHPIVPARTDVPALCDLAEEQAREIERLRAEVDTLRDPALLRNLEQWDILPGGTYEPAFMDRMERIGAEFRRLHAERDAAIFATKNPATIVQPGHEGNGAAIWDLVCGELEEQSPRNPRSDDAMALRRQVAADGRARDAFGAAKYGRRLRAGDGRDALVDAYQEALDQVVYLRKAVQEGRGVAQLYQRATEQAIALRAQINADTAQGIGGPT